jgi:hypothetical protein
MPLLAEVNSFIKIRIPMTSESGLIAESPWATVVELEEIWLGLDYGPFWQAVGLVEGASDKEV